MSRGQQPKRKLNPDGADPGPVLKKSRVEKSDNGTVLTSESLRDMQQHAIPCFAPPTVHSNTNSRVKYFEPHQCKNTTDPEFHKSVIRQASDLTQETIFTSDIEIWVLMNGVALLDIKNDNREPVSFESMNSKLSKAQRKERGPFYYPDESNPTHVLYKLRFNKPGFYRLTWSNTEKIEVWSNQVEVSKKPSKDDLEIKKSKRTKATNDDPKQRTSSLVHALLPANYDILYANECNMMANVAFVLPNDQRHHDCVLHALTRLRYQRSDGAKWFLTNKNLNVLVCSVDVLMMYRECQDIFNQYLLFIPNDSDTIQPVSKITKNGAPYINLKTRINGSEIAVPLEYLNEDEQAMMDLFQLSHVNGYAVLSNAARQDSQQLFEKYISRWLLGVELTLQQRPVFIEIKVVTVEGNNDRPIDQTADNIMQVINKTLPSGLSIQEVHYFGCVAVVISGPQILRWLVNVQKKTIAHELSERGLTLVSITDVNAQHLIQAMKNDPRNKQFACEIFSVVCKMLNNVLHKECVNSNAIKLTAQTPPVSQYPTPSKAQKKHIVILEKDPHWSLNSTEHSVFSLRPTKDCTSHGVISHAWSTGPLNCILYYNGDKPEAQVETQDTASLLYDYMVVVDRSRSIEDAQLLTSDGFVPLPQKLLNIPGGAGVKVPIYPAVCRCPHFKCVVRKHSIAGQTQPGCSYTIVRLFVYSQEFPDRGFVEQSALTYHITGSRPVMRSSLCRTPVRVTHEPYQAELKNETMLAYHDARTIRREKNSWKHM